MEAQIRMMNNDAVDSDMLADLAPNAISTDVFAAHDALHESNARFAVLTDAMPQMVWSTLPDGFHDYYNEQWYRFTGVAAGSTNGDGWNDIFHSDDQERAMVAWQASLASGKTYEIQYRLRHHSGVYRWVLGRALPVRDKQGRITRWIGTCTDIDAAKRAAEQNEVLSRELSHRIKNIFAVIVGLVGLSARREPAVKGFADDLRARIAALGRAHELVRPHSDESRPLLGDATLKAMLDDLLKAYPARDAGRLTIEGADVGIDDRGTTPVALVFHELATNAAKYGSLSAPEGSVAIDIATEGKTTTIVWRERGGPAQAGAPAVTGFGTRLVEMSIVQQLGGTIERIWHPEGLEVRMTVATNRLQR